MGDGSGIGEFGVGELGIQRVFLMGNSQFRDLFLEGEKDGICRFLLCVEILDLEVKVGWRVKDLKERWNQLRNLVIGREWKLVKCVGGGRFDSKLILIRNLGKDVQVFQGIGIEEV